MLSAGAIIFALAGTAQAASQDAGAATPASPGVNASVPAVQAIQERMEVRNEVREEVQANMEDSDGEEVNSAMPIRAQVREMMSDKASNSPIREQVRTQIQERDGSALSDDQKEAIASATAARAEARREIMASTTVQERRSQVANAVQTMLQLAAANGNTGLGEQIRTIAQTQVQNQEKLEASLAKVQNRGTLARFLLGPNHREINKARQTLEQNRTQIQQLNEAKNQLTDQAAQAQLAEQISALEQTDAEVENSLSSSQAGFSLLGWVSRWFNK